MVYLLAVHFIFTVQQFVAWAKLTLRIEQTCTPFTPQQRSISCYLSRWKNHTHRRLQLPFVLEFDTCNVTECQMVYFTHVVHHTMRETVTWSTINVNVVMIEFWITITPTPTITTIKTITIISATFLNWRNFAFSLHDHYRKIPDRLVNKLVFCPASWRSHHRKPCYQSAFHTRFVIWVMCVCHETLLHYQQTHFMCLLLYDDNLRSLPHDHKTLMLCQTKMLTDQSVITRVSVIY